MIDDEQSEDRSDRRCDEQSEDRSDRRCDEQSDDGPDRGPDEESVDRHHNRPDVGRVRAWLDRRSALRLGAAGAVSGLAGCNFAGLGDQQPAGPTTGEPSAAGPADGTPDEGAAGADVAAQEAGEDPGADDESTATTSLSVTGQLVDVHGDPVADASVRILRPSPREEVAATSSDADGRFTFRDLPLDRDYGEAILVARRRVTTDIAGTTVRNDWFKTRVYRSGSNSQFDLGEGDLGTIPLDRELLVAPTPVRDDDGEPLGMVTVWRVVGNEFQQRYTGLGDPTVQTYHVEVVNTHRSSGPGSFDPDAGIHAISGQSYDLSSGMFALTVPEGDVLVDYGSQDDLDLGASTTVAGIDTAVKAPEDPPSMIERWHPARTALPATEALLGTEPDQFERISTTDAEQIDRFEEGVGRLFSALPAVGQVYELVDTLGWAVGDRFELEGELSLPTVPSQTDPNTHDTPTIGWKSDNARALRDEAAVVCTVPVTFQYDTQDTSEFVVQSEWHLAHPDGATHGNGLLRWTFRRGPHGHIGGGGDDDDEDDDEDDVDSGMADSWTQYLHDSANTNVALETGGPTGQVETAWRFTSKGQAGPPVVDGSTVYLVSDRLYALDAETGDERWSVALTGEDGLGVGLVDDLVVVTAYNGVVLGIDAGSGDVRWRYEDLESVRTQPTLTEDRAYVGSDDYLHALSLETGDREWAVETPDIHAAPALGDGTVFLGTGSGSADTRGRVLAYDAETGDLQWWIALDDWVDGAPTYADGTVYVTCRDDFLYALDAGSGDEAWRYDAGYFMIRSATVADDLLYLPTRGQGAVRALDRETGDEKWEYILGGQSSFSPVLTSAGLYVGPGQEAEILLLDPATGDLRQEFGHSFSIVTQTPVPLGDRLYVVDYNDYGLRALEVDGASE